MFYIKPIIEYASVVRDGCTNYEKDKLDKLRHETARIVTGFTGIWQMNES